jgi:hypothetical protein
LTQKMEEMNVYLTYFPVPDDLVTVQKLGDDKLVKILDQAKPIEWQRNVLTANLDPYNMSLDNYVCYLKKLEIKH